MIYKVKLYVCVHQENRMDKVALKHHKISLEGLILLILILIASEISG